VSKRPVAAVALLVAASVSFAVVIGAQSPARTTPIPTGRLSSPAPTGRLSSPADAIAAAHEWSPVSLGEWEAKATLVERAENMAAVAPQLPADALSPEGFPGPVWVVSFTAISVGTKPRSFQEIFVARTGQPVILAAPRLRSCVSPIHDPC
jgi:hypothetical protein